MWLDFSVALRVQGYLFLVLLVIAVMVAAVAIGFALMPSAKL